MPEANFSQTNDRSLREIARDAESQVENLTRALETLRATVRRLAAQVEMSAGAEPSMGSGHGFGRAPQAETAQPVDEKPFDFSAAAAALSQEIESASHPGTPAEAPQSAMSLQEPVAHPAPTRPAAEPEWYGVSDGGSWPVGPKTTQPKHDEWAIEPAAPSEPAFEHEASDEEVELMAVVEDTTTDAAEPVAAATNDAFAFGAPVEADLPLSAEAADAAAQAAKEEQKRLSLSSGWPDEGIWSQSFDWPAMRSGTGTAPKEPPRAQGRVSFHGRPGAS